MMRNFGINPNGNVYLVPNGRPMILWGKRLDGRARVPIGHIGSLVRERGALADEVRRWWRAELTSDQPLTLLDEAAAEDGLAGIEVLETALAIGGELDDELVNVLVGG